MADRLLAHRIMVRLPPTSAMCVSPSAGAVGRSLSRRNARAALTLLPLTILLWSIGCSGTPVAPTSPGGTLSQVPQTPPAIVPPALIVAAGDIAVCRSEGAERTARLLDGIPGTVLALGDLAYPNGTPEEFRNCYEPTWGRHKDRTRPAPGNHDYQTPGASAYFEYFGASAGPPGVGYYSFELGSWHIVSLNSNVPVGARSAQAQWLRADLESNPSTCTMAFWHHPLFSSGQNGTTPRMVEIWRILYEMGVDVVLSAHDHTYERFAPQTPDGLYDEARGIRQFVVGTGGTPNLYRFPLVLPNSEIRYNSSWGVIKMMLNRDRYDWEFVSVQGGFSDVGTGTCH